MKKLGYFVTTLLFIGFVFVVTPVDAQTFIDKFYGGDTGLITQDRDFRDNKNTEKTAEKGGFMGFIARIFGFNKGDKKESDRKGSLYDRGKNDEENSSANNEEYDQLSQRPERERPLPPKANTIRDYKGPAPTLLCLPNKVESGEPALVLWRCNDFSENAVGQGFSTNGKAFGSAKASANISSKYSVTCHSGAYAECEVDVINPEIKITANKSEAIMWERINIFWQVADMKSCILESDDDNSKYKDWNRNGECDMSGDPCYAKSHPITKKTTFTLTCNTLSGLAKQESVTVDIAKQ